MKEGIEGFQKSASKPVVEENSTNTNFAQDAFGKMPLEQQEDFLNSMLRKGHEPSTLQDWYGAIDVQPLPPEPVRAAKLPITAEPVRAPEIPVTRENSFVCDTAYEYPGETPAEQERLAAFLNAACESADRLGKPFVQANYANGSRVYTYKKKGRRYIPKKVRREDVVDDFR